jgi:hypothetical protein
VVELLTNESVNIIRYSVSNEKGDLYQFRMDQNGDWVRFDDVWQELVQLREQVRALADAQRLHAALRPFAKAAKHGEEIARALADAGYGVMDCRDYFIEQASRYLSQADFREAVSALDRSQS